MVVVPKPKAAKGSKPHCKNYYFVKLCLSKFPLGKQMARLAKGSNERKANFIATTIISHHYHRRSKPSVC